MTIEFSCRDCQTTLRVGDEHAGKKARCPNCGSIQDVSGPSVISMGNESNENSAHSSDRWFMKIPDGSEFGPVAKQELDQWMREGRISLQCSLRMESDSQWKPASSLYPGLSNTNSINYSAPASQPAANPFAAPMTTEHPSFTGRAIQYRQHNGVAVLVLGILSCCICGLGLIMGPIAWAMGNTELGAVRRREVDPGAHGIIMGGYVCGIIGTCLNACWVLLICCSISM